MNELNDYYGYNLATIEGESLDIGGCVLTSPGLTDYELNKTYEKLVTLMVDGTYVGFAGIASAVAYICKAEKTKDITNITFWGDKDCLYSLKLRYLIGKEDPKELLNTDKDNQIFLTIKAKKGYLSRVMGHTLKRSINKYQINYKPFNY
tara:strand:+ start:164 stop:610 length:447 start_codon:yes stop_codon:yes gene_type:complete